MSYELIIFVVLVILLQYSLTCKHWFRFPTRLHEMLWSAGAWTGIMYSIHGLTPIPVTEEHPHLGQVETLAFTALYLLGIRYKVMSVYVPDPSSPVLLSREYPVGTRVLRTFFRELRADIRRLSAREIRVMKIYFWESVACVALLPFLPVVPWRDDLAWLAAVLVLSLVVQAGLMIATPRAP